MQDDLAISPEKLEEVLSLHEALKTLESLHPRQGKVVELRYFGGLSVDQIASLLGVSQRSVKRDWSLARIWLFRELKQDASLEHRK
jgi:RNA polymerase sigma factor (sigma-70 family)